eukprot:TRINITY_DN34242_c1_g1_i1.p1 TRINITY_DN34242_c1_g1~~TRINITY_DN34242_c1_g1_i1.p1  ORF type:complete len:140 (-),score=12.69 TRINITY_DN34242_c1_g1_i1:46-465(-)
MRPVVIFTLPVSEKLMGQTDRQTGRVESVRGAPSGQLFGLNKRKNNNRGKGVWLSHSELNIAQSSLSYMLSPARPSKCPLWRLIICGGQRSGGPFCAGLRSAPPTSRWTAADPSSGQLVQRSRTCGKKCRWVGLCVSVC